MARWAPARADVIDEYAAEVLGVFPHGRILLGLDRDDAEVGAAFATDLAASITAAGVPAAAVAFVDEPTFRIAVLGPFRAAALLPGDRAALVVHGQGLLEPGVVGLWHATAWLDVPGAPRIERRTIPRTRAAATFDLSDAAHPRRVFADAC
ncbi:MAG TPA: hypothetical protein VIG76_04415 [Amnibacterium sp.]|jgi:hypothetical protein|uniref:hypothetical protein n=1 Tax=Amnibacterium sp. TaxID=1872496 RepID=UPI002F958C87